MTAVEPSESAPDTACGWVVQEKGLRYLATDRGWLELRDEAGRAARSPGLSHGSPVRVRGRLTDPTAFIVDDVLSSSDATPGRPRFVVAPPDRAYLASEARHAVDEFLRSRRYPHVTLPTLWTLSREYGEEELRVSHSGLREELYLLQSPEFLMYAALAGGVERFSTWGRCFRYEAGEPAARYLMEFEQIDVGCAHSSLAEMLQLTEGIVRTVADVIGSAVTPEAFKVQQSVPTSTEADDGLVILSLPAALPNRARDVLRRRLEGAGAVIEDLDVGGRLAVRVDRNHDEVARIMDAAERIIGTYAPEVAAPVWRSPLPLEPDAREVNDSEYAVGSITSARVTTADGREMAEEAELYLSGYEIAHAGIFADAQQFRRNVAEAQVRDDRFAWLLPMLDVAPPHMAKVGIGWERLLGALLGGAEPSEFLLFPRSGTGAAR